MTVPAALEGLSPAQVRAVTTKVTPEMIEALVSCLSRDEYRYVDEVRREMMRRFDWFPLSRKPETQARFLRKIAEGALEAGYPVVTSNYGMKLGNYEEVIRCAEREEALARGAERKRDLLYRIAAGMRL